MGKDLGLAAAVQLGTLQQLGRDAGEELLGQEDVIRRDQARQHQRRVGERRRRADDTLLRAVLLLKVDHMPSIRAS